MFQLFMWSRLKSVHKLIFIAKTRARAAERRCSCGVLYAMANKGKSGASEEKWKFVILSDAWRKNIDIGALCKTLSTSTSNNYFLVSTLFWLNFIFFHALCVCWLLQLMSTNISPNGFFFLLSNLLHICGASFNWSYFFLKQQQAHDNFKTSKFITRTCGRNIERTYQKIA